MLVEMYANACRLRGAAQALQGNNSSSAPNYLQGCKYDEAYRVHFAAAIAGAGWEDIEAIVQAYSYTGTVIDGSLSIDHWNRDPATFAVKGTTVPGFAKTYATGAGMFCAAICRLEKRVSMSEAFNRAAFNRAVEKVKRDISSPLSGR